MIRGDVDRSDPNNVGSEQIDVRLRQDGHRGGRIGIAAQRVGRDRIGVTVGVRAGDPGADNHGATSQRGIG